MKTNQEPISPFVLIEQMKNKGFFVKENEHKVRQALCGFSRLMANHLPPEGIWAIERAELFATGNLSVDDLHQTRIEFMSICEGIQNQWADGAVLHALLENIIEAYYDDYLSYSVAYCRRADETIDDIIYCQILRDAFPYEG